MLSRRRGFSLIELLIVMALVACAYAFMFGPGTAWSQSRAKARCAQNLQAMHAALALYAAEHEGAFPSAPASATTSEPALSQLVPLYTTDTSIFICPGSGHRALPGAEPFANRSCSYAYVSGLRSGGPADQPLASDSQTGTGSKVAGEPLFARKGPGANHRGHGGAVLYLDGHVETQAELLAMRDFPLPHGTRLLNPKH